MKKSLLKSCSCIDIKVIMFFLLILIGGYFAFRKEEEDCNCN